MERGFRVRIEGAILVVCESCAERGEIIGEVSERKGSTPKDTTYVDLVEDFGKKIRERRKELKMDLKQLSRETGISVKTLRLIEEEKIIPTLEQVRRIERALDIKLVEEEEFQDLPRDRDFTITLGDVVRIK